MENFDAAQWPRVEFFPVPLPLAWDDLSVDHHPNDPPALLPSDLELAAAVREGAEVNLRRWYRFIGVRAGEHLELQLIGAKRRDYELNFFSHASSVDQFIQLAAEGEGMCPVGVFVIASAIDPAIVTRAAPDKWHPLKKGAGTSDADIRHRRVLFIDVDAKRGSGISSTWNEMCEAHAAAKRISARVAEILGDAASIGRGHSGNGGSVMLALDYLPVSHELTSLVREIIRGLKSVYESTSVTIDESVSDQKHLSPAFGTLKRKGVPNSPERPHRRGAFVCADEVRRLSLEELHKLRDALKASAPSAKVEAKPVATNVAREANAENAPARETPFTRANFQDPRAVAEFLGLFEAGSLVCPGCGNTAGVNIIDHGLHCFHNTCSTKGKPGKPGFRTNIDLVMEVKSVDKFEAVRLLAERFGFETFPPAAANRAANELANALGAIRSSKPKDVPAAVKLQAKTLGYFAGAELLERNEIVTALADAANEAGMQHAEELIATSVDEGIEEERNPKTWESVLRPVPSAWFLERPAPRTWLLRDTRSEGSPGVLPLGKTGSLIGEGGASKTMVLVQLSVAVATGTRWLDTFEIATTGRVLLLLGEEDVEEAHRRLYYASRGVEPPKQGSIVVMALAGEECALLQSDDDRQVRDSAFAEWLFGYLERESFALVIIDPLSRFAGPYAEIDNAHATRFVQSVERISKLAGSTTLVSHHTGKGFRGGAEVTAAASRGASALTDGFRWCAALGIEKIARKLEDAEARRHLGEVVTLSFVKSNYSLKGPPLQLRRNQNGALCVLDEVDRDIIEKATNGTAQAEARQEEAKANVKADAALVAAVIAQRPGFSVKELKSQMRAKHGKFADARTDTARAALGDAVVEKSGPHGAKLLFLDGSKLGQITDFLAPSERGALEASRPPS